MWAWCLWWELPRHSAVERLAWSCSANPSQSLKWNPLHLRWGNNHFFAESTRDLFKPYTGGWAACTIALLSWKSHLGLLANHAVSRRCIALPHLAMSVLADQNLQKWFFFLKYVQIHFSLVVGERCRNKTTRWWGSSALPSAARHSPGGCGVTAPHGARQRHAVLGQGLLPPGMQSLGPFKEQIQSKSISQLWASVSQAGKVNLPKTLLDFFLHAGWLVAFINPLYCFWYRCQSRWSKLIKKIYRSLEKTFCYWCLTSCSQNQALY